MKVHISLLTTSQPVEHLYVENTYTKDELYCVYIKEENKVYKYPILNIFQIKEDYK